VRADPTSSSLRGLTGPGGGLVLAVSVSPTRLVLGDTARFEVTLTNTTATAVTLDFPSGCQLHYEVEYASVYGDACGDALTSMTLAPDEARVEHAVWRAVGQDGAPLPVEGYMIVGTLGAHAPERVIDAPPKFIRVDP
jgi:hypothetical protein